MSTKSSFPATCRIGLVLLAFAACVCSSVVRAETPDNKDGTRVERQSKRAAAAQAVDKDDPRAAYQQVNLTELVPVSRTVGMRAIFEPKPVRFTARIAQMPAPQKADYLKQVMGMMGVTADLQVSQRVGLDYGGDKALAAYVEDQAADRIGKELKPGDERTFYAFHVYNNRYGPALVITTFEEK